MLVRITGLAGSLAKGDTLSRRTELPKVRTAPRELLHRGAKALSEDALQAAFRIVTRVQDSWGIVLRGELSD